MYTPNIDSVTGNEIPNSIKRISDGLVIEFDITKPEYQEYLSWYSEQNPIPIYQHQEPTISSMKYPTDYLKNDSNQIP
jgi:hypothetical protein